MHHHFWGIQALFVLAALMLLPLQHEGWDKATASHLQTLGVPSHLSIFTLPLPQAFHEPIKTAPETTRMESFQKGVGEVLLR